MSSARNALHVTLACTATVAATYGLARYSFGLFVPNIRSDFDLSASSAGVLSSVSFALYLLATVCAPLIAAAAGARLPVILGGVCATVGMLVVAISNDVWTLAIGVTVAGVSPGLAFPVMPDVIRQSITGDAQRGRALAVINAGTSLGIAISGPLAIVAGMQWRLAWIVFAVITLVCTIWVTAIVPRATPKARQITTKPVESTGSRLSLKRLPIGAARLLITAVVAAATTSVYWTFAVDLVVGSGRFSEQIGGTFFVIVGVCGIAGGFGGDLVARFGFRPVLALMVAALAGAMQLLPLAASWGSMLGVLLSAALFGAAFFAMTGILMIYSTKVFYAHPSTGLGALLFVVGIGQILGPVISGMAADIANLPLVFHVTGIAVLLIIALGPRGDDGHSVPASSGKSASEG